MSEDGAMGRRLAWLTWLAVAAPGALLILPWTRWLVVQQFLCLCCSRGVHPLHYFRFDAEPPRPVDYAAMARDLGRVAERFPADFELQLACALTAFGPVPLPERLRGLEAQFPDRPSLPAHILRYACLDEVRLDREENPLSAPSSPSAPAGPLRKAPTAAHLAAFDRAACAGQRLDPDNAYFPWMRMVGLLAAHRDREAWAALHEAAGKLRWDDYANEETLGRWRLRNQAWGERSVVSRALAHAGLVLPHLAPLRTVATVTLQQSIQDELEGRTAEGVARRHDLLRCASLMRVQSATGIGSLVGVAIGGIAVSRPGGAPPVNLPMGRASKEWAQAHLDAYLPYLERTGQGEAAGWVRAELEAGVRARDIVWEGSKASVLGGTAVRQLARQWLVDLAVLANAAWFLALAGVAVLLGRHWPGWGSGLILTGVALLGLGAMALALARGSAPLATWWSMASDTTGTSGQGVTPKLVVARLVLSALVLPALYLLPLLVLSLLGRVPSSSHVVGGALLLAGVLLLVYGGLVVATGRRETALNADVERLRQHEGRYSAGLVGKPWPEAVDVARKVSQ